VRAEAPRGFLDLNMDALKAGYSLHAAVDVRDEIAGAVGA
jgi:hypothetical protein